MSVAAIMISLYGSYQPTGVYSFEFRAGTKTITEIFLMLPPEAITMTEPRRGSLIPTLTGGYECDYGNDFKDIRISGSCHYYYAGTTNNPAKEYGSTSYLGVPGYLDGYMEYIKLRYALIRYRDYTMTPEAKMKAPNFSIQELSRVNALKKYVKSSIDNGKGALADKIELIWHDYDDDTHYKVRVEEFVSSRKKEDPHSVYYDIALKAYEVDNRKAGKLKFKKQNREKASAPEQIRSVLLLTSEMHPLSMPTVITAEGPGQVAYSTPNFAASEVENVPSVVTL